MKREALIRKIENGLLKLKKSIDYVAIVGFFYILLYRIDALRSICISVCIYIVEWFLPIELEIIKKFYLLIEGVFRVVILTSVICSIVSVLIRLIRDRIMQKKMVKTDLKRVYLGTCVKIQLHVVSWLRVNGVLEKHMKLINFLINTIDIRRREYIGCHVLA